MRGLAQILTAALLLSLPGIAYAVVNLTSAGGFLFDVQDMAGGQLSDGTSDAYDGCYLLEVNGSTYNSTGAATLTLGGRNAVLPQVSIGGLQVHREVYVPATGGDYARYLDVVSNAGASATTATIRIHGNLGSDSTTVLWGTSSGDALLSTADTWFGTDDVDASVDPSLAHVFQGPSPRVGASSVSLVRDELEWTFATSIPAGERVAVLTFAIQKTRQSEASTEARRLAELPDDALMGLDAVLDAIVNFPVAVAGAPRVRFGAPLEMDEGEEVDITIVVEDPEGDATTWSWDTDDDGVFGELPGADTHTLPAGSTDGESVVRVGVRASDGTHETERYRSITVRNVDPAITSSPPTTVASVGAVFRYPLEAFEPAGDRDPLTWELVRGPDGMVLGAGGVLTWTPRERDVTEPGETVPVEVSVSDDDGGTDGQRWEMVVSPNLAPSAPTPLWPIAGVGLLNDSPRLVAGNALDPDRDELTYFFEIDSTDTFDSENLQRSVGTGETPGYTAWPVAEPLSVGRWHWRVWVSDGTVVTEPRMETFFVVPDPSATPDAGPPAADGGTPDGGDPPGGAGGGDCGCSAPGGGTSPGLAWIALLGGAASALRRKRRRSA